MQIIYGAVEELRNKTNAKLLIHRVENDNLRNPEVNLTYNLGMKNIEIDADARVDEGDLLHVGDIEFKVIHTPGHTNGGTSLYSESNNLIFTGDTLFKGTYGRYDLPTRKQKRHNEFNKEQTTYTSRKCYDLSRTWNAKSNQR